MAISPPGDLLMDVARAADPRKAEAAEARLRTVARVSNASFDAGPEPANTVRREAPPPGNNAPEAFVRFEAMVLESFMRTMLPEDSTAFFGQGLAGEMWRGMLAQQLGDVMAKRGGIGIAERILGDHYVNDGKKVPVAGVSSGPDAEHSAKQATLSSALIEEIERQTVKSLAPGSAKSKS